MSKLSPEMYTVPVDGEYDPSVMRFLHIRTHLREELATGKYPYRVDITWPYDGDEKGLPDPETADAMKGFRERVIDEALERDKLALLAYEVVGEDRCLWSIYTRNIPAFQEMLNEASSELPDYPLEIYAEEDRGGLAFGEVEPLIAAE